MAFATLYFFAFTSFLCLCFPLSSSHCIKEGEGGAGGVADTAGCHFKWALSKLLSLHYRNENPFPSREGDCRGKKWYWSLGTQTTLLIPCSLFLSRIKRLNIQCPCEVGTNRGAVFYILTPMQWVYGKHTLSLTHT